MSQTTSASPLSAYAPVFQAAGTAWNVDPDLLRAVAGGESGGNPTAVSPAGAIGLMQIMPATAQGLGINPHDPEQSIYAAAKLLSDGIDQYGDPVAALKNYNAGPNQSHWSNPQTAAYPGRVAGFYQPGSVARDVAAMQGGMSGQANAASDPFADGTSPGAPLTQYAAANTGSMTDAAPSAAAPPASSAPPNSSSTGRPDDATLTSMLTGGSATAPSAASGSTAGPASSTGAPGRPSDSDMIASMTGAAPSTAANTPSSSGFLGSIATDAGNVASGFGHGVSVIGNALNSGLAAVDSRFPALQELDNGINYTADRQAANTQQAQANTTAYNAGAGKTLAGQIGNVAGQVATALPVVETGAGAVGELLGAGAEAVGGASTVAGRTLQAGQSLATGAAPTLPGRIISSITSGAAKGAASGALASDPSQAGTGAGWGAALGAALGPAGLAVAPVAKGIMTLTGRATGSLLDYLAPGAASGATASTDAAGAGAGAAADAGAAAPTAAASPVAPNPLAPGAGFAAAEAYKTPAAQAARAVQLLREMGVNGSDASAGENQLASASASPVPASAPAAPTSAPAPQANALASAPPRPGATEPQANALASPQAPLPPQAPTQAVPTTIGPQGLVLTQKGAGDTADKIIRMFAQGGPLAVTPQIANGAFDAAEATGNPGLSALRTYVMSNSPAAGNLFSGIKGVNNAARLQVMQGVMGAPADIDAAEAARDALTSQARDAAFSNAQPVDVQLFADQVQAAIDSKKGFPSVQKPLQDVLDNLNDISTTDPVTGATTADPEHLWNLRQQINASISPKAAGTAQDGRQAAAQLTALKPVLDSTIEPGAPGFTAFMKQYSDLTSPIDGMRWLQKQGIGITDGQGNITLAKLDSTIKNLSRQQGANGVSTADGVTPQQEQALLDLRENLRQAGAATYGGKLPGSDTVRNLGSNGLVNLLAGQGGVPTHALNTLLPSLGDAGAGPIGLMLGTAASGARLGAGAVGSRGSGMVMNALVNRLTNPELYQKAVNPLLSGGAR